MFKGQEFHINPHMLSIVQASNQMDSTLLITGRTGTGKSHLAQLVHRASPKRSNAKWHKVNLATLSENLVESELFGHERGAFTGADMRRVGKLESCNGGTVFLDEIGELPLRLQAKLLDFIQYKKITPVGSNREITLDVRIIAATNRNLEVAVKAGEFRVDLYHRLNVFHVRLPDLALNSKAIAMLAREFLNEKSVLTSKIFRGFAPEVEQLFRFYPWPGNIRELENMVEYAIAMEASELIQLTSLPMGMQEFARDSLQLQCESAPIPQTAETEVLRVKGTEGPLAVCYLELPMTMDFHESRAVFERTYLERALKICSGQINLTSRCIGLNKVSLADKIRRHGIDWRRIRYESLGPGLSAGQV